MARDVTKVRISKAKNGYVVQPVNDYGTDGEPEVFPTFEDALECVAKAFKEEAFAETVKSSHAMTMALSSLCHSAIAPKLLAIEAKVNPGVEHLVSDSHESLVS